MPDTSTSTQGVTRPPVLVDRIRCSGHGICAQTLPGAVTLDEWGYPMLAAQPRGESPGSRDIDLAIDLCPARALSRRL